MKKLSVVLPAVLVLCVMLFLMNRLQNAQEKIAVLDYKKIIAESSAVKKAGDYFSTLQEEYKVEIEKIKNKKEQASILEKKQMDFTTRIEAIDAYLNSTLENLIATYRKDNSITIILPKESVLSMDETVDITSNIIEKFNTIPLDAKTIQEIITKASEAKSDTPSNIAVPSLQ